ncbi:MAG: ankyrin repeat domain-containing protein [Nibricoccus sp.]
MCDDIQECKDTPATALWCAAYAGDTGQLQHLIAEDVDLNVWDEYGRNALTFACDAGNFEVVKQLVEAGAWVDPFENNDEYMTPLMCAARHGQTEIAEYLLDHGANPTLHGGSARTTAEYYARTDYPLLAAILKRAEDKWHLAHSQ